MKAKSFTQFISESEKTWIKTDPIDSRLRGPSRVRISGNTLKYEILKFIYISEDHGRSYTDSLKYVIEDIQGYKYQPTEHRGRYGTFLQGMGRSGLGILTQYCKKNEIGRWVLSDSALIKYFDKLRDEGQIKTLTQSSSMSDEELEAVKTLRELGIQINP
jgi:hypothetical protein